MELKTYFAQDASGNIMPGASVTVYLANTTTLATGLQDEAGAPLANPFTADSSAKVAFYAPDGLYDITVVGNGRTVTIRAQFFAIDGASVLRSDLAATGGSALVGYGSGTVKDALDALDFPALPSADLPIDDADLMLIRQGAGNKKLAISDLLSKIYAGDRLIFKPDANAVAFTKTGANTVSIKAGVKVDVGGKVIEFASATAVTMPTLTAGEDYAIWCTPAGALVCNADPFSLPASAPVVGSRKIGGLHYGLVAPGTTPASGSFATSGFTNQGGSMIWAQASVDRIAGINEFSLWDLAWRCKGQQRGMALDPQTETWHAIYFCSVNHITNGISRYNTDVASGTVLPRIPLVYGGNGSTNYGRLSQYECEEIAASFGLRLPTPDEFRSAMFGVTEGQSLGGAASTIPSTTRQPGYTSRIGVEQATGHEWVFARGNSSSGGTGFVTGPNRGDSYGNLFVTLLGCDRSGAANSGSRASFTNLGAWNSAWNIALRAAGDHLKHV